jgi:MFS family permease
MPAAEGSRFRRIAAAGIAFQGGAAAVDTSTIVAALVHQLTGSTLAVGAAAAIARAGWLVPQVVVGYLAQRRERRLPLYAFGAFGRAIALTAVAAVLLTVDEADSLGAVVAFFILWTLYAFISGVVAVPYNDIVARSVPSARRSRLLAWRFFGGGVLALAVAGAADRLLNGLPFPLGYSAVLLLGAVLLLASATFFISAGELVAPGREDGSFRAFLAAGVDVLRRDRRFRLFLLAQWLGGAAAMSLPFYIVALSSAHGPSTSVGLLLAAQTTGALLSNALWGWWGDALSKQSLLQAVAGLGVLPPLLALRWGGFAPDGAATIWFSWIFLLLGALGNGGTIAQLGYLMEISPDDRRPAYSAYFNVLVAPAALLPIAGAALADLASFKAVFAASAGASILQFLVVSRLRRAFGSGDER